MSPRKDHSTQLKFDVQDHCKNLPAGKNKLKNLVSRHHWGISELSASAPQAFRDAQEPVLVPETQTEALAQAHEARITKMTAPSPTGHKVSHISELSVYGPKGIWKSRSIPSRLCKQMVTQKAP